ncbi:alpha/beta-hydrolase [Polyplosphaeria fusca]|uniref:Alpha/beta-hydrolase n=1 Tax=Polyplosphaeria fusca TaxID=682080 RepID=A0A9P4QGS6_9PLEO|nr:alpha/beta-hydrolase [Polyplosphaeria fusca]
MKSPPLSSSFYTSPSGTKTHFLQSDASTGPLLICLHGLGGSTETFIPLLPSLPQTCNIVLVDFQGFGKTPLAESSKPLSVPGHVADLSHLIAHLQADSGPDKQQKIILIGHSLGAIIALHYAAQNPERIGGLTLLGAGRAAGHIPAVRQRMLDTAATVRTKGIDIVADGAVKGNFYEDTAERKAGPAAREAVRNAVAASDPEGYAQTCEAIVGLNHVDPDYGKITCPVVFIAGDKDVISPVQRSIDLSQLVAGKSWVEIVKSGHQPILEDLPAVKQALGKLVTIAGA